MILVCDTSALVKLYAQEQHSDWMRAQVVAASHCIASQIAWVEVLAAFGLKERTGQVDAKSARAALTRFRSEWPMFQRFAVNEAVLDQAGDLALRFGLRAYDSVQLATAAQAHAVLATRMGFCCFDKQLNTAAQALGITVLMPPPQ